MGSLQAGLPPASPDQAYVSVSALHAGSLTLPSHLFVHPSDLNARLTCPSLSFLIQQQPPTGSAQPTRILFDLGLRNPLDKYADPIREHIKTRCPISSTPDVVDSLALGGLKPDDIDYVILSHVHWDHIGTPSRFPRSKFVVGNGSLQLLNNGGDESTGSHAHFEKGLLPLDRTVELPPTAAANISTKRDDNLPSPPPSTNGTSMITDASTIDNPLSTTHWHPLPSFPHAIDFFRNGSLYLIDSPGHLQGHTNILARTGPSSWVYLAGDACHDRRILTGEVEIATWLDEGGKRCCIHVDRGEAERTVGRIRGVMGMEGVEVVLAHDVEWAEEKGNQGRFWPGVL